MSALVCLSRYATRSLHVTSQTQNQNDAYRLYKQTLEVCDAVATQTQNHSQNDIYRLCFQTLEVCDAFPARDKSDSESVSE